VIVGQGWGIEANLATIKAWSEVRLAFEPRAEMVAYRAALREALRRLEPIAGTGLRATYSAPSDEFVDVENVLLYNVGQGSYSHLAAHGLYLRKQRSPDVRHHVEYTVAPLPELTAQSRLLATINTELAVVPHTPGEWWSLLRPQVQAIEHSYGGRFALDVRLYGQWTGPGIASAMKPLLDGLISALHSHDESGRSELCERFAPLRDDASWNALCAPDPVLGPVRRLVRPHSVNVAWNPADDLCDELRIIPVAAPKHTLQARILAVD